MKPRNCLALVAVLAAVPLADGLAQQVQSDKSEICTIGYAHKHRMSWAEASRIKRSMLPPGVSMHDVILDHKTPIEIGGTNDRSNLMLQTPAESRIKDRLENFARRAYCSGGISLTEAQGWFVDWKASYKQVFGVAP